jgi:poly(ADP-ribose) glycohydrolase
MVFGNYEQFKAPAIHRELNKAYVGFLGDDFERESNAPNLPVCTGKWGCGAFGGDVQLKTVI